MERQLQNQAQHLGLWTTGSGLLLQEPLHVRTFGILRGAASSQGLASDRAGLTPGSAVPLGEAVTWSLCLFFCKTGVLKYYSTSGRRVINVTGKSKAPHECQFSSFHKSSVPLGVLYVLQRGLVCESTHKTLGQSTCVYACEIRKSWPGSHSERKPQRSLVWGGFRGWSL